MHVTLPRRIGYWIATVCCACCACGVGTASADTITLTFDHIGDADLYPETYTESGFFFSSLYPNGPHLHAGGGELVLHSRDGSSPYQIRRLDGGTFDFVAFDYFGGDSLFVSDTGASFTILGDQPRATFTMPASFRNATTITWYMNNPGDLSQPDPQWGTIDNIVMNLAPVPEPAQAALLGVGLAGLLLHARRRRPRDGAAG